ncbi:MAG: DUF2807 domain-containing protein [Bacteroidetes bacterium]|nr:DUF2807 domain-containing protein [Bacteroidota bacterium]MDA1120280.1 DUF2807 domain-containing protein [Bacteroidota bacterium]
MKTILTLVYVLIVFSLRAQQIQDRPQTEFTKIDLGGAFEVEIKESSRHHVRIDADEELMPDIVTEVNGSTLKVYIDRKRYDSKRKSSLVIEFVRLEEIEISGAVDIISAGKIRADDFKLDFSGAGEAKLELECSRLVVDISGVGDIEIEGRANEQTIDISGAGTYDAYDFDCDITNVETSGVGTAEVIANKEIKASTSGVGSIRYRGNPGRVDISTSGIGSIKKG